MIIKLTSMQAGWLIRLIEADERALDLIEEDFLNDLHRTLSAKGQTAEELSQPVSFANSDVCR